MTFGLSKSGTKNKNSRITLSTVNNSYELWEYLIFLYNWNLRILTCLIFLNLQTKILHTFSCFPSVVYIESNFDDLGEFLGHYWATTPPLLLLILWFSAARIKKRAHSEHRAAGSERNNGPLTQPCRLLMLESYALNWIFLATYQVYEGASEAGSRELGEEVIMPRQQQQIMWSLVVVFLITPNNSHWLAESVAITTTTTDKQVHMQVCAWRHFDWLLYFA